MRSFKQQIEDAEEIAALNLAKFRKAQSEVEEAEKRANIAEDALGKLRARSVFRHETPVSHPSLFELPLTFSWFLVICIVFRTILKTTWLSMKRDKSRQTGQSVTS